VLVSYKQGLTGNEDFYAPEEGWTFDPSDTRPAEICGHITGGWGYTAGTERRSVDDVWQYAASVWDRGWNLLLNTGPLPDGSIEPPDAEILRELGRRLRERNDE
jgi:alpha-L-fucosidase